MNLSHVINDLRKLLRAYDNTDIKSELDWAEQASMKLSELVLQYDLEEEQDTSNE